MSTPDVCWKGLSTTRRFFAYIRAADEKDDWREPATWAKANPGLGQTIKLDYLAQECKRAQEVPAYENTFKRLHLNMWTRQSTRWVSMERWAACRAEIDLDALKGRPCFGGLDLSSTTDVSAFSLLFPDDEGGYDLLNWFWIPAENMIERERRDRVPYMTWQRQGWVTATEGNVIDYDFIEQAITSLADKFEIREIGYDPWNATQLVLKLQDKGLAMVPVRQGFASMSAPSKAFESLILSGRLRHRGDPVMRWMVDSVTVAQDPAGNIKPVKPDRQQSANRIDGVVATINALDRATRNAGDGHSVYEVKELLLL